MYPDLTNDELDKIEYYEKWNLENEKARENKENDGEITLDKYGNFEFNFYKEEEVESEPGISKYIYSLYTYIIRNICMERWEVS